MYSTEAKIRQEAGFQSSINITSTVVVQYQTRAYNLVRSFVAGRYDITQFTGSLFTGSQAESVLEQCEILIAAGYLEQSQFEGQPRGENSGAKKVADAMATLKQIASGELRLIDANGSEFTSGGVSQEQSGSAEYTAPPRLNDNPTSSEKKFSVDTRF